MSERLVKRRSTKCWLRCAKPLISFVITLKKSKKTNVLLCGTFVPSPQFTGVHDQTWQCIVKARRTRVVGELTLRRAAEHAGLVEGTDFEMQVHTETEDGRSDQIWSSVFPMIA